MMLVVEQLVDRPVEQLLLDAQGLQQQPENKQAAQHAHEQPNDFQELIEQRLDLGIDKQQAKKCADNADPERVQK